jgi:hypothetical protein
MKYNHNRPLSDFQESIDILRKYGYKPIAVTQMQFEDTFVFETPEEALHAYNKFEKNPDMDSNDRLAGWWYGRTDFIQAVHEYENDEHTTSKVLIHWII